MKEIRIELMAQTSAKAVLEHIWSFDVDCQSKIIIFMWCWWSARNKINAGEKAKTAQQIISDVFFHLQAWRDTVSIEKRVIIPVCKPKWRPPPEEVYKINCDASYNPYSLKFGWGFIIRNHLGNVVAAGSESANFLMSV